MKDFLVEGEDKKNFHLKLINPSFKGKDGYVVFYSPTCPHCVNFVPEVEQLARRLKGAISIGTVNCKDTINGNDILADFYNISGVPTIKFYNGVNGEFIDYTGGHSVNDLLNFVCKTKNVCV